MFALADMAFYILIISGPSFAIDIACGTSLLGVDLARRAILSGKCDKAVICTAQMNLIPHTALLTHKLGMLSPGGACRAFDDSGNYFFI